MNFTILHYEVIGSTNDEAQRLARKGAEEGLCIVARQQTAGRGRHGRVWISPPGAGLYCSIVLRPKIEMRFLSLITLTTGVAVHDALEETFGLDCDVKWANDIHVRGRKICGILAESLETAKGLSVVVGIGINLRSANFPAEISDLVSSVEAETKQLPNPENVLQALTARFADLYKILQSGEKGASQIREAWAERSSYASGKTVRAVLENETVAGITDGIEENGALRIRTEKGEIKIIQAGEVEILRTN
jgi:BirA family biotin operon repressor/biotin-[acetyl-CoA-carboxylase] ligase